MDFFKIKERSVKKDQIDIYPDFIVTRSKDLMVRGHDFYAIWDESRGLWSTDEFDVQRLVDLELAEYKRNRGSAIGDAIVSVKYMLDFSSGSWMAFRKYLKHLSDSYHQLDERLTFSNTEVRKEDYVSKRLQYPLQSGSIAAYDEIVSTLYSPSERDKFEWAIGAVIAGDSRYLQKFLVFYGPAGAGKSTILNIIQELFAGYYVTFEAKALTSNNNAFSTEIFKNNPLVGIQHDGDLSRIEDNTKLNSIVSHEEMTMNEKFKASYMSRINAFLFMGTNKPVKITDAKSGIIRRLIDVQPTGNLIPEKRYHTLMAQVQFELGAIAKHCYDRYKELGREYYSSYRPTEMILQTDVFFNFIESNYDVFSKQEGITLAQAYEMYKVYCADSNVEYVLARHRFRDELKNYFRKFEDRAVVNGERVRSWYSVFHVDQFNVINPSESVNSTLDLKRQKSIFDELCMDQPAQYATENETPKQPWVDVTTALKDINTKELHYVKLPLNHIVIDFDLTDENGAKSASRNIAEAAKWPTTYAEASKGGEGIHLHYIYAGDVEKLSRVFSEGIEIKVFTGNASLRRKLTVCNAEPIATISGGLPLKEKKMINIDAVQSEKGLRELIARNLRKEIHPGTKPSMDFIHKILEDAYDSGLTYDVTDMRGAIMAFANGSSHQALYCLKLMQTMKFSSDQTAEVDPGDQGKIIFADVESFPNLFVLSWMYDDGDQVFSMINPSSKDVAFLLHEKFIGFNNRKYDNHMIYACYLGYSVEQLYILSVKLINNVPDATFGQAYGISYTDIYDYSSKKQSLKKWEIELKIAHKELGLPWDQPVKEEDIPKVVEYCENDVRATKATYHATEDDFKAREILAGLSGLTVNDTTQNHTAAIIFGNDKAPQDKFIYTDLSEMFPGYKFERMKSTYKGFEVGEGGFVYAVEGMYENVAVLDIASMHPTSIEQLDLFGPYTRNFTALKQARLAIKRGDFESASKMLNGALKPYLKDGEDASKLAHALKIVINIVYGLTAAKFDNRFRDRRNIDNIVAKRGALFMVDLKEFIESRGFVVVHIKTDSVKIPNATKEIIDEIMEFAHSYGYEFEHEATYDRMCLVNDAVYIAKVRAGRTPEHWEAVGAQFQHPYVFKKLFSGEEMTFDDWCEARSVTTSIWIDFNTEDTPMALQKPLHFVGRTGLFVPVSYNAGGGRLVRKAADGSFHAVTGTKGFYWLEAEVVKELEKYDAIDFSYFDKLVDSAVKNIEKYGSVEWLING